MKKIFLIGAIVIFIIALLFFLFFSQDHRNPEVTFLDVGQGDSVLIEAPQGQNILIDGGPDKKIMYSLGSALPFWERKIDLVILSHSHADHVTGLISVLKRFKVKKVLYNGENADSAVYKKFLQLARKKSELELVKNKKVVKTGNNCRLKIIPPTREIFRIDNSNNASLVSRLSCRGVSVLFAGDIEKEREERILTRDLKLKSDILKVAHHGSDTSNSKKFLKEVSPQAAVIQVGVDNDKGHPSSRIIKRLERLGVKIFRNDQAGSVEFLLQKDGIRPVFLP